MAITLCSIGQNIAAARKAKGLTQEDLAGLAEMNRAFLSNIENGKTSLSVMMLVRIAEALDVTPGALMK